MSRLRLSTGVSPTETCAATGGGGTGQREKICQLGEKKCNTSQAAQKWSGGVSCERKARGGYGKGETESSAPGDVTWNGNG